NVTDYIDNHIRDNPEQSPVLSKSLKGYLYMSSLNSSMEKNPKEALDWFQKALEENAKEMEDIKDGPVGDRMIILANKARTLLLLGENTEVEEIIDELIQLKKDHDSAKVKAYQQAHQAFAMHWFGPMKNKDAKSLFVDALKEFPEKESWLFGYARLIDKGRNFSRSRNMKQEASHEEKLYRQIITINPKNTLARVYLARKLAEKGSDWEAKHHFEKAMQYGEDKLIVVQRIAENYKWKNKLDEALEWFEKALKLEPDSAFVHLQMGSIYKTKYENAKKVGELSPESPNENLKNAIKYFELAMKESSGNNPRALSEAASAYVEMGDKIKAKEIYQKALNTADDEDRSAAHFQYAEFLDNHYKEDSKKVIEHYKKALSANSCCYKGKEA
uniref:Interferon-induced protein with tetratricopeptide repeats 5-like n=1 Tax=Saccoglossus kowalevskii TaxID=10224 RepID=A0ABM0MEP7_SACKO